MLCHLRRSPSSVEAPEEIIRAVEGAAHSWAHRILKESMGFAHVIVLKKNGVDMRLCIDYKMFNAITVLMEYAMPLVDDLLTELESYLWFCSLDAASGLWAVMMTQRAREISAFVCALGHFEWLRMPFGLKNASMICQRVVDNALWGFVQPRGGWNAHADRVRRAEAATSTQRQHRSSVNLGQSPRSLSLMPKFEAGLQASAESDPLQDLVNGPDGDMFSTGESDTSALTPVFQRRSFVDDICFGGTTFDECLETLKRLLTRFAECRISISFTKSIFVQPAVDFLSHEVSLSGIRANPAKMATIAELPFPKSKKVMQAFLGALNYYNRFIQNIAVYGAALYKLTDADFSEGGDLTAAESAFAELKKRVAQPPILRHFDTAREYSVATSRGEAPPRSVLWARALGERTRLSSRRDGSVGFAAPTEDLSYSPRREDPPCLHEIVYPGVGLPIEIKRVSKKDADFAQLLQATVKPHIGLDDSLSHLAPPSKNSATVRLDPELLYAHVLSTFEGHVLSFDGSAKTAKNGGNGSCYGAYRCGTLISLQVCTFHRLHKISGLSAILKLCIASLVKHSVFLRKTLPQSHPLSFTSLFRNDAMLSGLSGILAADAKTWMTPTGIPPHVDIYKHLQGVEQSIDNLPPVLIDGMSELIESKGVAVGNITRDVLESTIESALERAGLAHAQAEASQISSPESRSSTAHYYNGKFHMFPETFEFPKVGAYGAWQLWWFGDKTNGYPPLKRVGTHDLPREQMRKTFSD
ncbi:hypothetical protein ON010_g9179 [Phytophthora cinnamomi]|nr:hypothetical protein ON010_g9179 [Phytophthora cinnamomi]